MYQFKPGEETRFKLFEDYTSKDLNPWTGVIVDKVEDCKFEVFADVHMKEDPEKKFRVKYSDLQIPIGYEDIYTVGVTSVAEAEKVWSWLSAGRGIACWLSEDLSCAGRRMFTPGITGDGETVTKEDRSFRPHWSMGLVEVVNDPKRFKFEIVHSVYTKPDNVTRAEWLKQGWKRDKGNRDWYRVEAWTPPANVPTPA